MEHVPAGGNMEDALEQALAGGNVADAVVRAGNTVRKPAGYWTPSVEALLAHLEAGGFTARGCGTWPTRPRASCRWRTAATRSLTGCGCGCWRTGTS